MQNSKDAGGTVRPKSLDIQIAAQNFGPIAKAEIDLRPLTVFVGESNTGKTYLAALIYALHRTFDLPPENGEPASLWAAFKEPAAFEAELKRCFNIDAVSELIRFTDKAVCDEMQVILKVCADNQTHRVFQLRADTLGTAIDFPLPQGLQAAAPLSEGQNRAYFLPAVRSGLLEVHAPGKANGFSTDFLQQLVSKRHARQGTSDVMHGIADFLESKVLRGKIEVQHPVSEAHPEFLYRPQKGLRELRLHHASAQVSELAPLALFVRGVLRPGDLLIMEEPEAHLHPGAQAAIAVTLIRLVQTGVHVIVTTHSDWFLQQLGNTIRQGELEKLGERFEEQAEALRQEKVGVWLFQENSPVEEIPFDSIEGVEPQEYGDIAEGLYNRTVNLRARFREMIGARKVEHK